jgi:hypothetical protein
MDEGTIIAAIPAAIDKLRQRISGWPELWKVDDSDVEIGRHLTEALEPFLLDLIQQGLADKTLARHCDYLEMLGGEVIRRRHDEPGLTRQPAGDLLLKLIEEDGGPLIWPRVTETTQRELDATCRKLYRFLQSQNQRK